MTKTPLQHGKIYGATAIGLRGTICVGYEEPQAQALDNLTAFLAP